MSGHKQGINGRGVPEISAHPIIFTTDTNNSEKGILRVILREEYGICACFLSCAVL